MEADTERMRAALARNKDAAQSAALLIKGLVEKVRECLASSDSTASLKAFIDELESNTDPLAAAVVEGTQHQPSNQ